MPTPPFVRDEMAPPHVRQRIREDDALAKGAVRFWNRVEGVLDEEAKEVGIRGRSAIDISETRPGRRFIRQRVTRIVDRLKEEREKIAAGKGGRGPSI